MERYGERFDPIPRVLHQTWKNHDVPSEWKAWHESWKQHHPHWRHVLWTDEDNRRLVQERYPRFLETYDGLPRDIQRVDAAKYLILHAHGGVYADLDCECLRPIDPLLEDGGALVGRTPDGGAEIAVIASSAGHPLFEIALRNVGRPPWLARVLHRIPPLDASHVLLSTGPRMMKRAVREYAARARRNPGSAGMRICEPRLFSGRSWLKRHQPFDEDQAYVRHHYGDSWLRPSEQAVTALLTARKLKTATVLLAIGLGAAILAGALLR